VREETDLKLGIEADFVPGREDRMAALLAGATGTTSSARSTSSATRARLRPLRHLAHRESPERVWRTYFEWLGEAAAERDVRHPRPPGPRQALGPRAPEPERDLRSFYELAMEGIAESGIADRGSRRPGCASRSASCTPSSGLP
jgi:histidinol-phosphatase (PHP family)